MRENTSILSLVSLQYSSKAENLLSASLRVSPGNGWKEFAGLRTESRFFTSGL